MIQWVPFDNDKRGRIRRGPHVMTGKILSWRYCVHCGLLNLKNDVTRAALRAQCESVEDVE